MLLRRLRPSAQSLAVTQGISGLDFTLGSANTCTGTITAGTTCNVNVNFAPLAPGLRSGAVELFDNTGNPLATTPIYGVGQAPLVAFGPGFETSLPLAGLHYNVGVVVDAAGNTFVADYAAGKVVKAHASGRAEYGTRPPVCRPRSAWQWMEQAIFTSRI